MKTINTDCTKCFFAINKDNRPSCHFLIPESIKDSRTIKIIDGYNYIENYRCRYGVSKDTYDQKLKDMKIDIYNYAKTRVAPKYILYVCVDGEDTNLENVCNYITKLAAQPTKVKIALTPTFDRSNAVNICTKILSKTYEWKLHYFIEETSHQNMIKTCISTDNAMSYAQFIWILNEELLNYITQFNLDEKINFIINVMQPDMGLLNTRQSTDYFYGLFLTIDNYTTLASNKENTVGEIIQKYYINNISYYD